MRHRNCNYKSGPITNFVTKQDISLHSDEHAFTFTNGNAQTPNIYLLQGSLSLAPAVQFTALSKDVLNFVLILIAKFEALKQSSRSEATNMETKLNAHLKLI